ncbi:MAG TPA: single-stranded DNA-binding protein [Streptosporangiaceae bacterium]|nr:single-stranded DNA-binding protein [Streptosporangiaceae bacterium]
MANEPTTTITGNLTADPELRFTTTGIAVASFTIANTPRTRTHTGEWADGETWFLRCSAWRDLAHNIADTLTKGAAVIATGRLAARTFEATDQTTGQTVRRTVVEMTVDDLGPSLRRATAKVVKTTREYPTTNSGNGGGTTNGGATPPADPWATTQPVTAPAAAGPAPVGAAGGYPDDPPF